MLKESNPYYNKFLYVNYSAVLFIEMIFLYYEVILFF